MPGMYHNWTDRFNSFFCRCLFSCICSTEHFNTVNSIFTNFGNGFGIDWNRCWNDFVFGRNPHLVATSHSFLKKIDNRSTENMLDHPVDVKRNCWRRSQAGRFDADQIDQSR